MRWQIILSVVVIPLTAAFICTTRRTANRILIYDPQQHHQQHLRCPPSLRAATVRGRTLFTDETTDAGITAATTTTATRETRPKKKKPMTFSSTNTHSDNITTKPPVVVNEKESDHGEEEDDDGDDGDAISSTTSSSGAVVGKKRPSTLPVFRVVPARPVVSAVNGSGSSSIVFTVYGEPVPLSRHMVRVYVCMLQPLSILLFESFQFLVPL